MLVAINAGHHPVYDSGAVGARTTEVERTTQIANKTIEYLNAAGINTVFIQENELEDICNIANQNNVDLFISIHCNAAGNKSAKGTETYHANGSQRGQLLASKIQDQIISSLHTTDRGLKTANYYVLNGTDAPAVLVETAFISNPEDEDLLISRGDEFAAAIARGVTDFQLLTDYDHQPNENKPDAEQGPMQAKYFSTDELSCHCCGQLTVSQILLDLLDDIRGRVGAPVYISCAYRCPKHNQEVGGVPNSQHVQGTAADVLVPDGWTVDQLADLAVELNADGVGRYYDSGFVHVDVRAGRQQAGYYWTD